MYVQEVMSILHLAGAYSGRSGGKGDLNWRKETRPRYTLVNTSGRTRLTQS